MFFLRFFSRWALKGHWQHWTRECGHHSGEFINQTSQTRMVCVRVLPSLTSFVSAVFSFAIQFKMVSTRLGKPIICAPPRLSDVSPVLPFKQSQSFMDDDLFSSLEGRPLSVCSFYSSRQAVDGVLKSSMSSALPPQSELLSSSQKTTTSSSFLVLMCTA